MTRGPGARAARAPRRPSPPSVGIIGPGRAGVALALALRDAGVPVLGVHGRRRKRLPAGVRLSVGAAPPWLDEARVILLAVPDDALGALVGALAALGPRPKGQVILHLSGARSAASLARLRRRGAVVGGMHPLMTTMGVPALDAANLSAATFAVEGDEAAVRAARRLVAALDAAAVDVPARARTIYHAGAVFAANYVVTMMAAAEDLLVRAGFPRPAARRALVPLTGAAFMNVARSGPIEALTGPIARGDVATVRRHLDALPAAQRALYAAAGRATLALSRRAGRPGMTQTRMLEKVLR